MATQKRDADGTLLSQNGNNQPRKSASNPCDSLGGYTRQSQLPRVAEKHPGYKAGKRTYDPRVPVGAGDGHPHETELKAHPSHGGSVPSHKDVNEGQSGNYHIVQVRAEEQPKDVERVRNLFTSFSFQFRAVEPQMWTMFMD